MKRSHKTLVFVVLLVVLAAAAIVLATGAADLPIRDWLEFGVSWIETHRTLSWAVFLVAYVAVTVLLVPATFPTLAAGFLFGMPFGLVLVSAGSLLSASSAFLVGRFFARDWVKRRIERLAWFNALDIATRTDGFTIVALSRLSPLFPFFLLNYAFSVTGVRFRDYVLATWIGLLPILVLYVYVGSVAQDLMALTGGQFDDSPFGLALLIGGLAATVLLVVVITRKATRVLGRHLQHEAAGDIDVDTAAGADAEEAAGHRRRPRIDS
ncbi:TVP38/TMEM64 family protein [Candidatus Rariloculus sp.]|uniref:TVP38/TMEM64 family protein n=1 Tax=Candidatus Rariloculus sp. TaxID=3101265 RepID=UPI003D0AB347